MKILKFHCKKNLQIKFDYFSRFKEKEMVLFEKDFNEFLVSNELNYISDDLTIDQKMTDFIEKFKNDKFKLFKYDDSIRTHLIDSNNSMQKLNNDDKKKINKMNLNFHFMNNMRSILNNIQSFSNLAELKITINKKSDWFINNHKKIIKNLKNIYSLKIKFDEQKEEIELVELVDNVTKLCENLKEVEFFITGKFNKKTAEKIIDLLLEKKRKKNISKNCIIYY